MPWSITLEIVWYTLVMIVVPPGDPSTMNSRPRGSSTIVGAIDESGRLPV